MRLPITPQISTKDGVSNKNARLTNCLKEVKKAGEKAVVRPGLVLDAQASGVGNGLVVFNNELVSVYGATLGIGVDAAATGATTIVGDITPAISFVGYSSFLGGNKFLVGGGADWDETDPDVQLYVVDTSDDSATRVGGFGGQCYTTGICVGGTSVVVIDLSTSATIVYTATISYPLIFASTSTPAKIPVSMKYAGGKFVAIHIGTNCEISWSSDDGATWSAYELPKTGGEDLLYDGTAWWFYGITLSSPTPWAYKTTDFITFTEQTLTGLRANEYPTSCAYADGVYYLNGYSAGLDNKLYLSSNGKDWVDTEDVYLWLKTYSDGNVYGIEDSTGDLYRLDGAVKTLIYSGVRASSQQDADCLSDSSVFIYADNYPDVTRIDSAENGSIPALTTITGDYYDFAQSPL